MVLSVCVGHSECAGIDLAVAVAFCICDLRPSCIIVYRWGKIPPLSFEIYCHCHFLISEVGFSEVAVVFHLLAGDRLGAVGVCNTANYVSYAARVFGCSGGRGRRTGDLAIRINIDCTGACWMMTLLVFLLNEWCLQKSLWCGQHTLCADGLQLFIHSFCSFEVP